MAPALVEAVLRKLGMPGAPPTDLDGLTDLYRRWCRGVPFDNVRKRIALAEGHSGPLPGDDPTDFFQGWLAHGTGGTCWAGNGALHGLLRALGFDARRGVGTMLPTPDADVPPNHGTVSVLIEESRFMVDASLLHNRPLELVPGVDTAIESGAWGVRTRWHQDRLFVTWHPLRVESMECRIETLEADGDVFSRRHEMARTRSGFNHQLTVRTLRGDAVLAVVLGDWMTRTATGDQHRRPLQGAERLAFMTEELGMSEEIAARLPADEPVPEEYRP